MKCCINCGSVTELIDDGEKIYISCPNCNVKWTQDQHTDFIKNVISRINKLESQIAEILKKLDKYL